MPGFLASVTGDSRAGISPLVGGAWALGVLGLVMGRAGTWGFWLQERRVSQG